ncbi:MAG: MscL family protein, partial [Blastocatellia bacterium]|nr:MscL family protein [Blastocatellia bacterium]
MFRGFRDFILKGNVLDLAVAVIMGAAFGAVVNSVVKNLITPLIALAGGAPDFSAIRTGPFLWGNILNDVLTFLITSAVIYFIIVLPVSRVLARLKPAE